MSVIEDCTYTIATMKIKRGILVFFMYEYFIQHSLICRSSDFTVSENAGILPRTVETLALIKSDALINQLQISSVIRQNLIHNGQLASGLVYQS